MNIIPGEPVPPGFEDEVNRQPQIQESLNQYKGNSLIGIEYTVELHEDDRREPGYLCTLCDKRGDARTIINHWCSFNHRMKYLEKHYPSAVREFQPVKYKPNSHNIMILIVQSLAEAIEEHHGRLQVSVMNADDFRKRKTAITEQILTKKHFDETNGPNFLNAIDRTLWEQGALKKKDVHAIIRVPKRINNNSTGNGKPTIKDGLDEISSDDDNQDSVKKPKIVRGKETDVKIKPITEVPEKKLPTPKELSLQASNFAQERYKWEKYRCMLEIQLKQMEKIQADYEKVPEKHPHYPEEWKKFWNRRYKELQAEKKVDPNKHDYKPEWIIFWTKRMKELFNVEVEKKKKEIKVKLGLPEDAEEKVDQLKEKYKVAVNRVPSTNKASSRGVTSLDVIDISDDDSPRQARYNRSRRSRSRSRSRSSRERGRPRDYKRSRSRSRSLSSFSDEYEITSSSKHHLHKKLHNPIRHYNIDHPTDYYTYSRNSRYPSSTALSSHYQPSGHHYRVLDSSKIPKYQEPEFRTSKEPKEESKMEEPEGPLTVVAVLRLLTALEEHLGSLGPKVVDMLGKALALEKVKGNSSDDLLTNEDHCVFFETIKEKLKGLVIADVLEDQQKVKAVKRAIKNIAAIIYQVNTKGSTIEKTNNNKDEVNTTDILAKGKKLPNKMSAGPNIKDLPFNRQTVATKMAAALVMQGREDVSTADMDKLIYLFILMVKLSKPKREDDGKPLYCNDILPLLGITRKLPTTSLSFANLPSIVDNLLENEVTSFVQDVDLEIENEVAENDKELKGDANSSMLESLTDSDLQTLLQNFKHLSSEEQHHLIAHLKKLESADPCRVEKLRKFVNISDLTGSAEYSAKSYKTSDSTPTKSSSSRSKSHLDDSPPSGTRKGNTAPPPGTEDDDESNGRRRVNASKFSLDDDEDDDYNFEDVFKAASSNVNRLPEENSRQSGRHNKSPIVPVSSSPSALTFNPAGLKTSLNDTQNLIANIMGSLQQSNSNSANKSSASSDKHAADSVSLRSMPQPVPPAVVATQQQMPPEQQPHQMAFYQQNQQHQQGYSGPYNQVNAAQANYYNSMGGYNQNPYDSYQQWGQGQQQQIPHNMQQFGMQGFGMTPQQMGYNMYGQGRN